MVSNDGKKMAAWILATCCLCLAACNRTCKNQIDCLTLIPGQSKIYSFSTQNSMRIGVLIDHEVMGGIVDLQQVGSVNRCGTGHGWMSREWSPIDGKIELKVINNSKEKVEATIFKGREPEYP
jgi:hypothetical protein